MLNYYKPFKIQFKIISFIQLLVFIVLIKVLLLISKKEIFFKKIINLFYLIYKI